MAIPYRYIRKVIRISNSFYVSLPEIWCKAVNIKKKDKVLLKIYTDKVVVTKDNDDRTKSK